VNSFKARVMRHLSRLLPAAFIVFAFGFAPAASAQTTAASAQSFIDDNVQRGLTILNNGALAPADRRAQFETLLISITDLDRTAAFTLGDYKSKSNEADVSAFTSEFQRYAVAVYQSYFSRYSGQTLKITGAAEHAPGDVLVSTLLVSPQGEAPQPIEFRVIDENGKPRIVDFSVDGVWLAQEERDQFVAFLGQHGGSVPALTDHLKQIETTYK
jgi:phospholipid transport system substrate-binding protein